MHAKLIIGHHPKAYRSPAPKHPSCTIRTTWIFREKKWECIENNVDMSTLANRTAKLVDGVTVSLTVFRKPESSKDHEPASDDEAVGEQPPDESPGRDLKAEAQSPEHLFHHRPKNPYCEVCQRSKMMAPQARKRGGSSTIKSESYGDHITIDHVITRDLKDQGIGDERVALVVKDVFSSFRYIYPSATKSSDQCYEDLQHYLGAEDTVGTVYSDNAPELRAAVKQLGIRHNTSREYVDENKAVIEREIRTLLEGTRCNLSQSGLPDKLWPYAAQHHAVALNVSPRLGFDSKDTPWKLRYGEDFNGLIVPFGAKVLFWNNPKQGVPKVSKFAPSSAEGIFLGYHIQPGFVWKQEYVVTPVAGVQQALENNSLPILRAKRMELLQGDFVFPARPEELDRAALTEVPALESQDCPPDPPVTGGGGEKEFQFPDEWLEEYDYVPGEGDEAGDDEDMMEQERRQERASESPADRKVSPDASSSAKPKEPHDPDKYPDGTSVPPGYTWDGIRLVRKKKGSKRPPDTPADIWHMKSARQREEDIARYEKLVAERERERVDALRKESPAMPVTHAPVVEEHRERITDLYWNKLGEVTMGQLALVARVVGKAEINQTPEAKAAMDKEWKKLADKSCWLEKQVREYKDVAKEAQQKNLKTHFGRIFEICALKGSELPEGHPERKWKGRSVFQGNQVRDESNDHALFAELGSSPASMEAGKILDVFGSQPGYSKQQADARQAYTQALFKGVETWVRLPRDRWPKGWEKFNDPVCPLRLALYGHPDSGGIWEQHCTQMLESVGWVAVLPGVWLSVFYHPKLDCLLVVYVDDFKMAGPTDNMKEAWKTIESVLDMDPAVPVGRYFGCNHIEENNVTLPRDAHPFAYVFDKGESSFAVAARKGGPERTEDYWEVEHDAGAVVRHHVYPCRKLYVPTEGDLAQFPTLGTSRVTVANFTHL